MLILAKILKALHSDAGPWQLAFGIVLGMIMGLTPLLRLHNIVLLFFVLFFRVNLATFLLSFGLFSGLAYALDPVMINVGESLLTSEGLQATWTAFYNTMPGRLSQFYHTLTIGSIALSVLFAPILLLLSKYLIIQYRSRFLKWTEKFWLLELLKSSRVYQIFEKIRD